MSIKIKKYQKKMKVGFIQRKTKFKEQKLLETKH